MIKIVVDAISRFSVFLGQACSSLYLLCIAFSVYEVIMRYFMNAPTQWTFEVIMTLCASAWLLSAGFVTERDAHISITMLVSVLPPRPQLRLRIFQYAIGAASLGVLAYAAWHPAEMALVTLERSGSAFNPPSPAFLKTLLPITAAMGAVQMVVNLIRALMPVKAE